MSEQKLKQLAIRQRELELSKESLEAQLTVINKELDQIRTKDIPNIMNDLGITNCTFEGLGRVQITNDLYLSTREGQKEAAIKWLVDCGYSNMITETYNASSLKALMRRLLADGAEIPDEIFSVTPFQRASVVKK